MEEKASYFTMLFFCGGNIKSIIYKIESKDYYVFYENGKEIRCTLRGKFKKEFALKKDKQYKLDIAVVGDIVEFDFNEDGSGVLTEIQERKNYISRKAPKIKGAGHRGERLEQVIAANIDELYLVASIKSPEFNDRQVDRILVIAESSHIPANIIINKSDLDEKKETDYWYNIYTKLGYKVFITSVKKNTGFQILKNSLEGKKCLFWGTSGVGKSSILNHMFPGLDFSTGEISTFTDKGKHTTVTSIMKNVGENTFVIDTPGIREIDPYGIKKTDLCHFFREFEEHIHYCRFSTCTHNHEPGCAVIDAVNDGLISPERYQSYLNMLDTVEDDMNF